MNTVHWSCFGLFPLQICGVKSIVPEEGCVFAHVCVFACVNQKEQRGSRQVTLQQTFE